MGQPFYNPFAPDPSKTGDAVPYYKPVKPLKGMGNIGNDPKHIKAMQQFLISQGYDLPGGADGIRGAGTDSAVSDWHGKRNPKAWNSHNAPEASTSITKPSPSVTLPKNVSGTSPAPAVTSPAAAPSGEDILTQLLGGTNTTPGGLTFDTKVKARTIDPKLVASTIGGSYLGPVNQAQRSITQAQRDSKNNLGAINRQYDAALTANTASQRSGDEFLKGILGDDSASQAIAQNAGDPAAVEQLGKLGGMGTNFLKSIGTIQHNYASNIGTALESQRANDLTTQRQSDADHLGDVRGQLADLIAQRTSALGTGKLNAISANNTARTNADNESFNRKLQVAQYGTQQDQARLNNVLTVLGFGGDQITQGLNNQLTGQNIKNAGLQGQLTEAEIAQAGNTKATGGFNLNDPETVVGLGQTLETMVRAKRGGFGVKPKLAGDILDGYLRQLGVQDSPKAQAIKTEVLRRVLNEEHSRGGYSQVTLGKGGALNIPRSKKKVGAKEKTTDSSGGFHNPFGSLGSFLDPFKKIGSLGGIAP
jgi:hypothetical protein